MSNASPATLVGVVSFGQRCGDESHPTVYTRVASVRRFVDRQLRNSRRAGEIALACERRVCRIRVRLSQAGPRVAALAVAIGKRRLRARRIAARRWQVIARVPRGAVRLSAYAFTSGGALAAPPVRRTVRVSDRGKVT